MESLRQFGMTRRRLLMAGSGVGLLNLAGPARAVLDESALQRLLGRAVPDELRRILPGEAVGAAELIAQVIGLEQEAKARQLPASPLSIEGSIAPDPERIYELVMPRLVALVDRSEPTSPAFADRAGELLAKLHQSQRVVAEALAGLPPELNVLRGVLPFSDQVEAQVDLKLPPPVTAPVPKPAPTPTAEPQPEPQPEQAAPPPAAPLPPISTSLRYADLREEYAAWFAAAELRPEHKESTDWHLALLRQARPRYAEVGRRVGVPWYFIGAIHGLEASFNFRAHLHNGDFPLQQRTRQVPAGRPRVWLPPSDWASSALDALRLLGFAGQEDWSLPRTLYRLEAYNGFGYRKMALPSPYLWCFSSHYNRGKFVADGRYDGRARSQQCGAAVMLKLLDQVGELQA